MSDSDFAGRVLGVDDLLTDAGQDNLDAGLAGRMITGAALLDLINVKPAPRQSILVDRTSDEEKPWLVRGKTGLLVAPGGGGKTGLLMQMAAAVATGRDWLGYGTRTRPGEKVLVVLGEEDLGEVHIRLWHLTIGLSDQDRKNLAAQLFVLPMHSQSVRFDAGFCGALHAYLQDNGPWCLVIMDPASRFMGTDVEVDNAAATIFVESVERLTTVPGGPAVLLGHHTNKGALGGGKTDQSAARGSSALVDGVRWVCNMELVDDPDHLTDKKYRDWRVLRVVKTNYTARTKAQHIRYDSGKWCLVPDAMLAERTALVGKPETKANQGASKKSSAPNRARTDAEKDMA
jgi:regulatory protein RepA